MSEASLHIAQPWTLREDRGSTVLERRGIRMLEPAEHYHDIDYYANPVSLRSFFVDTTASHLNYLSDK